MRHENRSGETGRGGQESPKAEAEKGKEMMDRYLSAEELLEIPEALMPMPVLSDNLQSPVSAGIKAHTHGCYGHFMWLIAPGAFASMQTNGYKMVKVEDFIGSDRLKLWYFPGWTEADRAKVRKAIDKELNRPWWKNRYDFFSYLGHLTGLRWIQSPWSDVCSDKGKFIGLVEKDFNLRAPNPEEVNHWLESIKPRAQIYGRYTPD